MNRNKTSPRTLAFLSAIALLLAVHEIITPFGISAGLYAASLFWGLLSIHKALSEAVKALKAEP